MANEIDDILGDLSLDDLEAELDGLTLDEPVAEKPAAKETKPSQEEIEEAAEEEGDLDELLEELNANGVIPAAEATKDEKESLETPDPKADAKQDSVFTDDELKEAEELLTSTFIEKTKAIEKEKARLDNEFRETPHSVNPMQLRKDTSINPESISDGMIAQAGLFAYYAMVAAESQRVFEDTKMRRELLESKIDQEVRDEAVTTGAKVTEKMIESTIKGDRRYIKATQELNKKRAEAELAKYALEALKQKRDMLVQIGVSMREEMKGELRIKAVETSIESSRAAALEAVRASANA